MRRDTEIMSCRDWKSTPAKQVLRRRSLIAFVVTPLVAIAAYGTARAASRGTTTDKTAAHFTLNDVRAEASDARTSELVCDLSAFFSVDPEEVIRNRAHLEGRGLVTCRNSQGFTTELPVRAEVDATLPEHFDRESEFSFSANSTPFVIQREVSQLQDNFSIAPALEPSETLPSAPAVLLRGAHHDLIMSVKLNSPKSKLSGLKLTAVNLHFDDEAPDLF